MVPCDEIVELQWCSLRPNCWMCNYCAARLQAACSSRATSSSLQLDYLNAWDHKRLVHKFTLVAVIVPTSCGERVERRQYCEKSNHVIKYLRSGCNAEGSSENDNRTGLEDLFAAVGGGVRGRYRIAAQHACRAL